MIAMAGASGFVEPALRRSLRDRHGQTGLTRYPNVAVLASGTPGERWRHCDLFSLSSVTDVNPDESRQMEQCYSYCLGYAAELVRIRVAKPVYLVSSSSGEAAGSWSAPSSYARCGPA